jgi:signal peptidase II
VNDPKPAMLRVKHFLVAIAVFVADQITKGMVERMPMHDSIQVVPHVFRLTHIENPGAAFGLFQESTSQWKIVLLIAFSVLALVVVLTLLWRMNHSRIAGVALVLILGGASGNLFDRLLHGSVVDFLLFYVSRYEWPAFNIADSAIVIGASLLVWDILRGGSAAREPQPQIAVSGED